MLITIYSDYISARLTAICPVIFHVLKSVSVPSCATILFIFQISVVFNISLSLSHCRCFKSVLVLVIITFCADI